MTLLTHSTLDTTALPGIEAPFTEHDQRKGKNKKQKNKKK